MMSCMNYKGYIGELRVDLDAGVIRGKVVNTRDTITFQCKTVEEARGAFLDSVDDYLEFCASTGDPPEKPFSGRFVVRVRPEVHRELSALAQIRGISLNKLVLRQLSRLAKSAKGGQAKKVAGDVGVAPPSAETTGRTAAVRKRLKAADAASPKKGAASA